MSDLDVHKDDYEGADDGCTKLWYKKFRTVLGNTDITCTPDDPVSISEVVNRSLGNNLLETLVEQSNVYHVQNADKYKSPQSP